MKNTTDFLVNKVGPVLFFVGILAFIFFKSRGNERMNSEINKNGSFFIGVIYKKDASKGGHRHIRYAFKKNKKRYDFSDYVSKSFFNKCEVGDTIVIKSIVKDTDKSIISQISKYKSCFGIPPKMGWEKLPVCDK